MKITLKSFIIDLLFYLIGSIIYSLAIPAFVSPAHISPGGFTGVALIFNYLIKAPIGLTLLLLNIPLMLAAYKRLGIYFILRSCAITVLVSVFLDVSEKLTPPFKGDAILNAIFGGILIGLGLGLIMLRGGTTGGVDIIAKLINLKFPHISVGRVILLFDGIVVLISALCYKNLSGMLYSAITIYVTSVSLDFVLYGGDKGKLVYVISENGKAISKEILRGISRGVTEIDATGAYTGKNRKMLMCAVRRQEVSFICKIVKEHDANAFIIVCDAGEIMGLGFKE
ncbi:MAG: YitT family protein [Clostridia bacterium]|nr:YitT family protein [Clostridia bacterium]